jgi:hypothetical protein
MKFLKVIFGVRAANAKSAAILLKLIRYAYKVFGVDPASILPEIKHVPNLWISLIGYQAKGYSPVPVY